MKSVLAVLVLVAVLAACHEVKQEQHLSDSTAVKVDSLLVDSVKLDTLK
jgi:ABC-type uncharacterized transport system auxiliary subunit